MTGAGPIQMDDFPVLEYAAPQAFYIGRTARRLHRFDERTWQMGVASPEKNSRLAGLSEAGLKAIFGGEYKSVNPELQSYISLLYEGRLAANSESVGGGLTLPCVFGGQSRAVLKPPPAAATNLVARQLFEAEVALQSDATQAQALGQIENILDSTQTYREPQAGWSATFYTGLAVKASLRRGEAQRAKKILLRGLQLEPDSEVDQYLARILVRENILQPEEITAASAK
jgi:hypothetical protein